MPKPKEPSSPSSCLSLAFTSLLLSSIVTLHFTSWSLVLLDTDTQLHMPDNSLQTPHLSPLGDDEELMRVASRTAEDVTQCHTKKLAFMFLTRGGMPLRALWERFFKGHDGLFSIYVHTSPEYQEEPPEGSVFFHRRIPSKPVKWGTSAMVDAERRLLAHALLDDPCNHRFILLSESCIPLFNFSVVSARLLHSNRSHVDSFDDPCRVGRGRYPLSLSLLIPLRDWRKGSQWFELRRDLAIAVVSDAVYYPLFKQHCTSPCYADEHYLATLITKFAPERNAGRSLTYVDWSRGGSHPAAYRGREVTEGLLMRMREGGARGGRRCTDEHGGCYLFARKFQRSSIGPLMRIAPKLMIFS